MYVSTTLAALQLQQLYLPDSSACVNLQIANQNIWQRRDLQFLATVERAVNMTSIEYCVPLGCGPPPAAVDSQQKGGIGIICILNKNGSEVIKCAAMESNGTIHRRELVKAIPLQTVVNGDVAPIAVYVETVEIRVFYIGIIHIVGTEDTPVGE